ncbi:hypothetical protein GVK21_10820 [Listeria monocytogenes]|nr:hypothetical protein [Listeria monocytogenes]EDN8923585.1 hypothetical protein [Listeria monocytogenes]
MPLFLTNTAKKIFKNNNTLPVQQANSHLYYIIYALIDESGNQTLAKDYYRATDDALADSSYYLNQSILEGIMEELSSLHQKEVFIINIIPLGNW